MSIVNHQIPKRDSLFGLQKINRKNIENSDSVLKSSNPVTKEELQDNSLFADLINNTAVKIGVAIVGSVAAGLVLKKTGAVNHLVSKLQKFFPVIEENGFKYQKIFGKKININLSTTKYEGIQIPNNNLMDKRVKNPHPTNLTNELERCNYRPNQVDSLFRSNHQLSRTVGSLPSAWAKIFKNSEIQQKVDDVLSKYAREFHAVEEGKLPSITSVQKELSDILGTDVKIQYLGSGKIGNAYKISAFSEDCVYKVFFNKPMFRGNTLGHGNYPELLSAIQANKYDPKHFAKFYMGRFGEMHDGYILTKFIPEVSAKTANTNGNRTLFSQYTKRMTSEDINSANVRNGIILDYGTAGFTSYSKLSPKAQKITRELFPILDGKSSKKVAKVLEKYSGTKEIEEVKNYIQSIIEWNFRHNPAFFASKKKHLANLNLDYRPDIRVLLNKNIMLEPYLKEYDLTIEQAKKLRTEFQNLKKS